MTDKQFSKLPKWAQTEFLKLQEQNTLLRQAANANGDYRECPIYWEKSVFAGAGGAIPEGARVVFKVGEDRIELRLNQEGIDEWLDVRTVVKSLVVRPAVSNRIQVKGDEWV